MDTYALAERALEQVPIHSRELNTFASLLQNYLNPTFTSFDLSIQNSEISLSTAKLPPSPSRVHTLLVQLCQLLKTRESCLWVVTLGFLEGFMTSIHYNQLPKETARLVFIELAQALNGLPPNCPLGLGTPIQRILNYLWRGTPQTREVGFLTTYELHQLQGSRLPFHFLLQPFLDEVKLVTKALFFLLFPTDANFPLLAPPFGQYSGDDLRIWEKIPELSETCVWYTENGYLASMTSQLDDLLYQGAPLAALNQHIRDDNDKLLQSLAFKVTRVCKDIQSRSDFVTRQPEEQILDTINNLKLAVPSNIKFWGLVQILGDQLYTLVEQKKFRYAEIVNLFSTLVDSKPTDIEESVERTFPKDNTLLWLILQLFYLEHFKEDIHKDFTSTEELFHKLVSLYNPVQTESVDAFHFRDLALQCALVHQQESILDRPSLKIRLPGLIPALKYSQVTYKLHNQFIQLHERVLSRQFFDPPELGDRFKLGVAGQLRQGPYFQALYVNLVPPSPGYGSVVYPSCTFIQGGIIHYQVLDLVPVETKIKLLQLIFAASLNGQKGPQSHAKDIPPPACVSPSITDTVYRLIYSSPLASEATVYSVLYSLRTSEVELAESSQPTREVTLRWKVTLLQLFNYRLLRYLKNSNFASSLVGCISTSIVSQSHPQLYTETECFVSNIIWIQTSLQSLIEGAHFGSSTYLALLTVLKAFRIIRIRGKSDIPKELLLVFFNNFPVHIHQATVAQFPDYIKQHFQNYSPNHSPTETLDQTQAILSQWEQAHSSLFEGEADLQQLVPLYLVSQHLLLPMAWKMITTKRTISPSLLKLIQSVLTQIGPVGHFDRTCRLLDVIMLLPGINEAGPFLDELIWKYHVVSFHHVLFALSCYHPSGPNLESRWALLNFLLFQSVEFKNRYDFWVELFGASHRVWLEHDYFSKHLQFLKKFPEPFQFEACTSDHVDVYSESSSALHPHLPSFYGNSLMRVLQILEYVVGTWLEHGQVVIFESFLNAYPHLVRFHQFPITLVYNVLRHYSNSPCFTAPLRRRWVAQLDLTKAFFSVPFSQYLTEASGGSNFLNAEYFNILIKRLAYAVDSTTSELEREEHPNAPERHYREITNPVTLAVMLASVELLAIPHTPSEIIGYLLSAISGPKNSLNFYTLSEIRGLGLLLSQLSDEYVYPVIDAVINSVVSNNDVTYASAGPYSLQAKFGLNTPHAMLFALYHSVMHYSSSDHSEYLVSLLKRLETQISSSQLYLLFSLAGNLLFRLINKSQFDELFTCLVSMVIWAASRGDVDVEAPLSLLCLTRRRHSLDLPHLNDLLRPHLAHPAPSPEKVFARLFALL